MSAAGTITVEAECGGAVIRIKRKDLEDSDSQDPNFFDDDYTVAAATGFTVWDGAWALISQLNGVLGDELKGKRVVELGSGTGLAGLCAAACGGHVLLSDVSSVVGDMLWPNIRLNGIGPAIEPNEKVRLNGDGAAVQPHGKTESPAVRLNGIEEAIEPDDIAGITESANGEIAAASRHVASPAAWPGAVGIGANGGTASALTIDWFKQLPAAVSGAWLDVILTSEAVWLQELVDPFVRTLASLLRLRTRDGAPVVAYIVCRERAKDTSLTFAHLSSVLEHFEAHGLSSELVSTVQGPEKQPTKTFRVTAL
ncbi:hypothetical protein DIPPA_30348 [Diplonema papillatum]|nr:hypothetical protein DIPPA_30348 [Diplonema papillatum]